MAEPLAHRSSPFAPLDRRPAAARIADEIRRRILAGTYPPGTRLPPERELARAFEVTRATVKQALLDLERGGLITTRHGVGSLVRDPAAAAGIELVQHLLVRDGSLDADLLQGVFELREWIGTRMAGAAARRRRRRHLAALDRVLAGFTPACPPEQAQRLDMEFFVQLAEATGNAALRLLVNSVSAAYAAHAGRFLPAFRDAAAVGARLREIRNAVASRNATAAQAAAGRHLTATATDMLAAGTGRTAPRARRP